MQNFNILLTAYRDAIKKRDMYVVDMDDNNAAQCRALDKFDRAISHYEDKLYNFGSYGILYEVTGKMEGKRYDKFFYKDFILYLKDIEKEFIPELVKYKYKNILVNTINIKEIPLGKLLNH